MRLRFNRLRVPWLTTRKHNNTASQMEAGGGAGTANTNGLMNMQDLPQPQWTKFEDAVKWDPEEHVVMYCMNGQDNVPARVKMDNEFVYYISQSRSPGHKDQGQDCMATARQGDWEVHLLCDGHDKAGHMVALGICQQLPKIILRRIQERNKDTSNPCDPDDAVSDTLLGDAFDEAARVVCWTRDGITVGIWVKVFDGQWAEKPGYIKESNGQGKVKVAIIDENGYHLPAVDRSSLRRPRYTGGCTSLCLVRNRKTKECKIAVSGDSRMLIMPTMGVNDAVLLRQSGMDEAGGSNKEEPPQGLITPAHNVYNDDERERLERDYQGQYEFDGNFLVNPITKFAIQPTRGFGDFDMFGTGYTHKPEITKTFTLEPNGLIFSASDGVFDSHVWADEEIVSCLDKYVEDGLTSAQIVENMYRETLQRSLEGGYVDDISIFCFKEGSIDVPVAAVVPEPSKPEVLNDVMDMPSPKKIKKKKDTRAQRRTIGRGGESYTELSAKVLELKKKKLEEEEEAEKEATEPQNEKLEDFVDEGHEVLGGVTKVMQNLAASHKLEDEIDAKGLLSGRSFSELKPEENGNAEEDDDDENDDDPAANLI